MKRILVAVVICVFALALEGCGIHTRSVRLQVPTAEAFGGRPAPVVLVSVNDDRNLTNAPSSMGHSVSPQLIRAIGDGKTASMIAGDGGGKNAFVIELADGKTVASVVNDLISNILVSHGYKVVGDSSSYADAPHLTVDVTKFFLYQPFNFFRALTWTMQMKANIETRITIAQHGSSQTIAVLGKGANIVQTNSDENYIETYSAAMADYKRAFEADVLRHLNQGDKQ
jgi:hypothetical protein